VLPAQSSASLEQKESATEPADPAVFSVQEFSCCELPAQAQTTANTKLAGYELLNSATIHLVNRTLYAHFGNNKCVILKGEWR
jgi:hypothetical protein